jgi:glycosyltransferase involved in cell wall biosynthesis
LAHALQSILVTPNACGADGVSRLSRGIAAALPGPSALVSLHDSSDTTVAGVPLQAAAGSRARFCANVARLVPQCGRDTLVICSHLHLAPAARVLTCRAGRSVVVLCGIEAWVSMRAAERWALSASRIIAISEHTARRFKEANPAFQDADVTVAHPGLPDWTSEPRADDGQSSTALIVGRMAADEGYKGHDLLIDIWPRVRERHRDATLCIVGDGTDRARLEAKAAAQGLAGAVRFEGLIDESRLDALYRRCRFFVMPSRDEGFGFVYLEAMRAGKPCVGAHGAATEIIRHGETGWIVDPDNPGEVADRLTGLFDDQTMCDAFGLAGRRLFCERFTDVRFRARWAHACDQKLPT